MPEVLAMKDNHPETVFSPMDFEELIDKHMGWDCAKYYHNQIEQLSSYIRELDGYVDDSAVHSDTEEVLKCNGY